MTATARAAVRTSADGGDMRPRLGWLGDDFTGATDTLAVLTQAGLRAMLFLDVPDACVLESAEQVLGGPLDAVGIAGATRAMAPPAMAAALQPLGAFFAQLGVRLLHYKVCSTFDSAPEVGSIGAAVRALHPHMRHPLVMVLGGQPSLGRYCVFSTLFASAGAGGEVHRIDRHPTMACHPVTPMAEADLRRHLALQGLAPVVALHGTAYRMPPDVQRAQLARALEQGAQAVLMDLSDASQLAPAGRLLWEHAQAAPLLAVGASSVAQALVAHWREAGAPVASQVAAPQGPAWPAATAPCLVFAGSLSPVTARQVAAARSFERMPLTPADLAAPDGRAARRLHAALDAGAHVLAWTAPAAGQATDTRDAAAVAAATARFLRGLVQHRAAAGRPLQRLGIAGGDTSSLSVQALGLWGLSYCTQLGPGVAISRAHSAVPGVDGLQLMLKGGQMGAEDVFDAFVQGA